ncbi:MAG TPA: NADP-dependent malic enzyme [Euryarchaeota archaeon]|nr:NADP-dependent malic enzyme [Euryarchaeota archaeon]
MSPDDNSGKESNEKKKSNNAEVEKLLQKAYEPARLAKIYHPFYEGKIEVVPKCPIHDFNDFAIWYTPGVAEPCKIINKDPEEAYHQTNKWNNVAVVTDGTRVLGLGDIGPEAGLPVMEGKALLFKYLGGVDAFPICLNTKDPEKIIETVKLLQPSFGGINLEDISQPKCFRILEKLRVECEIPVWHDDQQGTAAIVTSGVINAVKLAGKKLNEVKIVLNGAGAANIATARVLTVAGADLKNLVMLDSKGVLHPGRSDIDKVAWKEKWWIATESNKEGLTGHLDEAIKGADVLVAASKPGPGTIKPDSIRLMADDAIVFPVANPIPEIWPWEAKEAGALVIGTGRSDFPNQVNNSLGFPGIFRGALDIKAKTITDEMCVAASKELAKIAEDKGLTPEYIIPNMDEWEVFPREAVAVALKGIEQDVARIKHSKQELFEKAEAMIKRAREQTKCLMSQGFIKPFPKA